MSEVAPIARVAATQTLLVKPGTPERGHGAAMAMQVSSSGSRNLQSLVTFVVDANRPFSSPAPVP